jgi:hypothetical protein
MTTTAQSIILQAQQQLQDADGVRWPATDLVTHLNAGIRQLVELRPAEFALTISHPLVAGARQVMPANNALLLEIPRNTTGGPIRPVDRTQLELVDDKWYTATGKLKIVHTTHDPRDPQVFYVWPAAAVGAEVEMVYAAWPDAVAVPSGPAASTVTGDIPANDRFANCLLHFVLFRAFSVDAEFGGNGALSAAHYQLFTTLAGAPAPAVAAKD